MTLAPSLATRIAVAGANGRMGQRLVTLAGETPDFDVSATLNRGAPPALNQAEVLIDFTHSAALESHLSACRAQGAALVLGTTGLSAADEKMLGEAARHIPIVRSANMSIGINLLALFAEKLAAALDPSFDIEITETHHRDKKDAPSGTALMLGKAAARGRGVDFDTAAILSRSGETGARPIGAIGFSALRGGSVAGEHSVFYLGDSEHLSLSHKALDRDVFARGALTAARWVKGRENGLYTMSDVLGRVLDRTLDRG